METYDSVIIGGGPAGLTAALYLLRSGLRVLLIEKLSPGGQILLTEEIENYPGFPGGVKGFELVDLLVEQVEPYGLARINDEVKSIEIGKTHNIHVGDETVEARTILLCTGARYRNLGVPGEKEFLGRGVSYCALCDGNFYRGQEVAVIGGGNSALEESLYLARIVGKVHLIHRREEFRGQQCYLDKCVLASNLVIHRSTVVRAIQGDGSGVTHLDLERTDSGEKSELPVTGVFVFVGFDPVMGFVPKDVDSDRNGVITDTEMRTNVPGIFAAGDVRSKKCRQVASAVGDGATAATAAHNYLESLDA